MNEQFIEMMERAKFLLRINQKELARRLERSGSALSEIRKGKKNPSSELFEKLSVLLSEIENKDIEINQVKTETIKDRVKLFLEYLGISQQKFETETKLSNGFVNNIGYNISEKSTKRIAERYPELNITWLKSGVGSMLTTGDNEVTLETPEDDNQETTAKLVPLLPIAAQGGSLNDFVVSVKDSDCEKVVSPIKGAQFAMPVSGDSMAPEYPNGSQIFIKRINEKAFIEWGKVYVLDTCNGTVIKILVPSEKDGYVRCLSINKDPIFAPFDVSWSDVYGVYRVLLCMSVK